MDHISVGKGFNIYQLNIEGASASKSEYLSRKAYDHKVDVIVVQETHINRGEEYHTRGLVKGYYVVAYLLSPVYGIATYLRNDIKDVKVMELSSENDIFRIVTAVGDHTVTNIYKPPNAAWTNNPVPNNFLCHPSICLGDFNSHHMSWGYNANDPNGDALKEWSESRNLFLVFDAKDRKTFFSARWRRGYNPDICFVSKDRSDRPLPVTRKVLEDFPRGQHRPILLQTGTKIFFAKSKQKPRWNFTKADWIRFALQVDAAIRFVPCKLKNYTRFLGVIKQRKNAYPEVFGKNIFPGGLRKWMKC